MKTRATNSINNNQYFGPVTVGLQNISQSEENKKSYINLCLPVT